MLEETKIALIKMTQQNIFKDEDHCLRTMQESIGLNKVLSKNSMIFHFYIFLNKDQVIRVCGRVKNSSLIIAIIRSF